jgi:hypothetical protein
VDGNIFDRTALEQLQKEGVTLVSHLLFEINHFNCWFLMSFVLKLLCAEFESSHFAFKLHIRVILNLMGLFVPYDFSLVVLHTISLIFVHSWRMLMGGYLK